MKKILITGAGSYVGESVRKYILAKDSLYRIDTVDTMDDNWKKADYSQYDVVYHVAHNSIVIFLQFQELPYLLMF